MRESDLLKRGVEHQRMNSRHLADADAGDGHVDAAAPAHCRGQTARGARGCIFLHGVVRFDDCGIEAQRSGEASRGIGDNHFEQRGTDAEIWRDEHTTLRLFHAGKNPRRRFVPASHADHDRDSGSKARFDICLDSLGDAHINCNIGRRRPKRCRCENVMSAKAANHFDLAFRRQRDDLASQSTDADDCDSQRHDALPSNSAACRARIASGTSLSSSRIVRLMALALSDSM